MQCDRAAEALIDRRTEPLSADTEAELRAHLETCASCRADAAAIERVWADLDTLAPAPDQAATSHAAARLLGTRSDVAWRGRRRALVGLRVAALIALLVGAAVAGRLTAPVPPFDAGGSYLLLLRDDPTAPIPGGEAIARAVADYGAWASRLHGDGRLLAAEKLDDDGAIWIPARHEDAPVSGLFIIRAASRDEAEAIARTGPHAAHGTLVEVRRITDVGGGP